jgi:hypothetical protein
MVFIDAPICSTALAAAPAAVVWSLLPSAMRRAASASEADAAVTWRALPPAVFSVATSRDCMRSSAAIIGLSATARRSKAWSSRPSATLAANSTACWLRSTIRASITARWHSTPASTTT